MTEILELRINSKYSNLLFDASEGKKVSSTVTIIRIKRSDLRWEQIPVIAKFVKVQSNDTFFFGWKTIRTYTKKELNTAKLFHLKIKNKFEPAGEECGTIYDESVSCSICGANRQQISELKLKYKSIPNKDISITVGGEVVVSEKFLTALRKYNLRGVLHKDISLGNNSSPQFYQLVPTEEIELTENTIAGINPFDFSESDGKEIYKCPKGHTIGLNLISEIKIMDSLVIKENDFFASKQKIGVKRGLLRPEPSLICSAKFRTMVLEENLTGFDFDVAYIEQ